MSIRCSKCGREFDVTLFEYGREIHCPCGAVVSLADGHTVFDWDSLEREIFDAVDSRDRDRDGKRAEMFRRKADRITSLILYSDMPRVDIEIEIRSFRREILAVFPGKEELFDALYLGRFRRIWEQFRDEGETLCGQD